ncbi:non-ribosomal peptide synthetase [Streptomyces sp. BA2]|uniref:non-ribosomal peptide synthetase n=1 Tax=Streptomyces sp. BA2 TaxID=436595 RepID=UPI00136C6090|nr:non-ribosomal peptide synthetase [Streptomyces sp. BA2]
MSMFPLSYAQQRMWFLNRFDEPGPAYNVPLVVRVGGVLEASVVESAWVDVVERHQVLRTVFREVGGEPGQVVLPLAEAGVVVKVVDAVSGDVGAVVRELAELPFDLDVDVLVRASLVRVSAVEHVLVLVMHHAVCDGWSLGPLLRDLEVAYNARVAGGVPEWEPLPVQYADYALWQRELLGDEGDAQSVVSRQLAYWREALEGLPEELALPYDHARPPVASNRGGVVEFPVPPEVHAGLVEIARQSQATLFMVVQAAVAALLSRLGAGTDIPLGTSVAGRTDEELDDLVGFFVNTLVLRTDLTGDPTFLELVERVRDFSFAAYAHQDLPFERVVEDLNPTRTRSRHPLFQVNVELHEAGTPQLRLTGLDTSLEVVSTPTAKFDLSWDFVETAPGAGGTPGLTGRLTYATDLFERSMADRLGEWTLRLLAAVAARPATSVRGIGLLAAAEERELLDEARPAHEGIETGVVERVRRHAAERPDATAVIDDHGPVGYGQLVGRSSGLARTLTSTGVQVGTVVAVLAHRGAQAVTAILGITTAGGVYLPLDPKAPPARTLGLLRDAGCSLLLADTTHLAAARHLAAEGTGTGQALRVLPVDAPADPLDSLVPVKGGPDDLAYVIFTSGSTGRPKGAMVHRRGMMNNLLCEAEAVGIDGPRTVASTAPLTFDISVWQMFVPLVFGGTVRALPDEIVRDPSGLFALAADEGIDVLQVVPSLLQAAVDEWDDGARPPALRLDRLAVTGEALPAALCHRWGARYPHIPLVNCYGPTECSDDVTHAVIDPAGLPADYRTPIGRAVRGSRLYVLDDALGLTPPGVVGELYIGGIVVGRGYFGDPPRTASTFVADPFCPEPGRRMYRTGDLVRRREDGQLEFLGRRDHQVKIRGQRIELGEIEHAFQATGLVRGAAVVVREDVVGDKRLVAYVVPAVGVSVDVGVLRGEMGRVLPDYMVPSAVVVLGALPLTRNGKLDRRALPVPDYGALSAGREPRSERERGVAALFAEVLRVESVSLDDNFFELGGHSLLATRLVNRIRTTLGADLSLRQLFDTPTVAALVEAVERQEPVTAARPRLVRRDRQG